jgi:hypothetical protein
MRLLDFIEQQCAGGGLGERYTEKSDLANTSAEQHAKTFLRLILGHIESEQFVFA